MDGTNPRIEIGGNNPPGTLELEREAALMAEVDAFNLEQPEITDTDTAGQAQGLVDQARALKKDLTAAQKVELAPLEGAIAEVKAKYRGPLDRLEAALKALLEKSGAWIVKERARVAREKAEQEAAARRLREEAERLEREAQEAAQNLSVETEAAVQADAAATTAGKVAREAEKAAEKKAAPVVIKAAGAARAMTMRAYWSAEVTDEGEALRSYASHPTVRAECLKVALRLANELARTEKREDAAPAGFRFIKEERAS